ncbi:MAG TPA: CBS domain-containing protein [Myxococcaceae bacterium]|nr:CBS domain-containing protein [Myxococcaceae bacterium]
MRPATRVAELMSTAVICVRDTDTIETALKEMHRAAVHHLPVVDEHLNLVGVLSSTDILAGPRHRAPEQRIGRFMSRSVVTVAPETSVSRAMDLMTDNVFRSLPVVDSDGHLIGILTDTDLLGSSRSSPGDSKSPRR